MDKNITISDSLQKSDLFKGLTAEQNDAVFKSGLRKKLHPKNILFHQGDSAKKFYLVNQGRLKLTKLNEQGKEVIFRYIGAGEVTAAVAVYKNREYPVTAESVEETDVTGWDRQTMMQLIRRYPDIAINLLDITLDRVEDVQNRYLELCTERVEQRIALTLLRLLRSAGVKTSEGIYIDIPLGRQNIADYTGTTLYTVSRTLSSWEKRGWIKSSRERVVITDPHSLVQFSETI